MAIPSEEAQTCEMWGLGEGRKDTAFEEQGSNMKGTQRNFGILYSPSRTQSQKSQPTISWMGCYHT